MSFAKNLLIAAASLLIPVTGFGLASCQNQPPSSSSGDLVIDKPVRLVAEGPHEVVFISLPNQRRSPDSSAFSPAIIRIDSSGKQTTATVTRHQVKYKDSVTGDSNTLELLSFESASGRHWIADPGSQTPQLVPHPQDTSKLLFQPQYNLGGLYLLDAKKLQVTPIGDHTALRQAIAKKRSLSASVPPPNCKELECEAGARIIYWAADPTWSPSGRQIAFTSNRHTLGAGADLAIWVLDVATNKETKVTGSKGEGFRIYGFSADGRILAWQYSRKPEALIAVRPDTQEKQILLEGEFIEFLAQSDDYKTLLYATRPRREHSSEVGFTKLYAFSLDTRKSQLLFEETKAERLSGLRPDFSAKSDRIVAELTNPLGVHTLFVYDLKKHQALRLPIPAGKRLLATERKLAWAGDRLVLPLENTQDQSFSTLLVDVRF